MYLGFLIAFRYYGGSLGEVHIHKVICQYGTTHGSDPDGIFLYAHFFNHLHDQAVSSSMATTRTI